MLARACVSRALLWSQAARGYGHKQLSAFASQAEDKESKARPLAFCSQHVRPSPPPFPELVPISDLNKKALSFGLM